jgi:hypothetical protein
MVPDLSERETRLLEALVHIVDHILCHPEFVKGEEDDLIDTSAMGAGERSLLALEQYGLANLCPPTLRLGQWTDAGQDLRRAMREKHASETFKHSLPTVPWIPDPAFNAETALGISRREAILLEAASHMAQTYFVTERVIEILAEYGLVEPEASGRYSGRWTEAGEKFEDWCARHN